MNYGPVNRTSIVTGGLVNRTPIVNGGLVNRTSIVNGGLVNRTSIVNGESVNKTSIMNVGLVNRTTIVNDGPVNRTQIVDGGLINLVWRKLQKNRCVRRFDTLTCKEHCEKNLITLKYIAQLAARNRHGLKVRTSQAILDSKENIHSS